MKVTSHLKTKQNKPQNLMVCNTDTITNAQLVTIKIIKNSVGFLLFSFKEVLFHVSYSIYHACMHFTDSFIFLCFKSNTHF